MKQANQKILEKDSETSTQLIEIRKHLKEVQQVNNQLEEKISVPDSAGIEMTEMQAKIRQLEYSVAEVNAKYVG